MTLGEGVNGEIGEMLGNSYIRENFAELTSGLTKKMEGINVDY